MLLERPGEVVSRDELRDKLWTSDTFVDFDNGVNIAVKKLRGALCDDAESPRYIETLPRRGYRFIGAVAQHEVPRQNSLEPDVTVPEPATVDLPVRRKATKIGIAIGLTATVAVLLLLLWKIPFLRNLGMRGQPGGKITSIAVLPLQNLSGNPAEDYFADGMTEELITDLAQIKSLRVISRTSSMQYKDTHKSMADIGRELSVDAVVEGAVVRSGNRVRITAQLIQAAKDQHLWAASYEENISDVLSVQSRVAHDIAQEVRAELTPREQNQLNSTRTVDPRAYEAYLKGRYETNKLTEDGMAKGLEYYRQSIAIDPDYAPAYAGMAFNYLAQNEWTLSPREAMPLANAAARKALQLAPSLAEPHAQLAVVHFWYDWNRGASEEEFQQAIALNPNDAWVRELHGACLAWAGHPDAGIAEGKRALSLDPLSVEAATFLGGDYYFARRYDESIAQLRQAVRMQPGYWFARMNLGVSYLQAGRVKEGVEELEAAYQLEPGIPDSLAALGRGYAAAGQPAKVRRILEKLQGKWPHAYVPPYHVATVYAALGDKDRAFAWLDKAYQERSMYLTWINTDPELDSLRSDKRFAALKERIGLRCKMSAVRPVPRFAAPSFGRYLG